MVVPAAGDDRIAEASIIARGRHLSEYDCFILAPASRRFGRYELLGYGERVSVPDHYLGDDRRGYSPLLVSRGFYNLFADYEWLLVCQLDAIVLSDSLELMISAANFPAAAHGFDYIGAPCLGTPMPWVRNGGLSLRRREACERVLDGRAEWLDVEAYWRQFGVGEDVFWSRTAGELAPFRVASALQSLAFSFESEPRTCYHLSGDRLPFGCHAPHRYDPAFWREVAPEMMPELVTTGP